MHHYGPPTNGSNSANYIYPTTVPPACDLKYDMAWGESESFQRANSNQLNLIRGMPPVTPDPKMHMNMSL